MRRMWGYVAAVAIVAVAACSGGPPSSPNASPGRPVSLVLWMGYTPPPPASQAAEYRSLVRLANRFARLHPTIHIQVRYVSNDEALQQATVALQGGRQPDISYQYGTSMPQLAQAPALADLTQAVKHPQYGWPDFFTGERDVATVSGKTFGIPALVDNLAVVYNKQLFAAHHLAPPSPGWTWGQLVADAKAIADPARKIYGLTFPADGSENTVWQYEAMLWEAGGHILAPGNTRAAFNSPAGVRALATLARLARARALYLDAHPDAGKSEALFSSGHLGMIITGPWDLSALGSARYGVQIMPSFRPGGSHQTISGPDNWVVFNNGPARVAASLEFLRFLTSPASELANSLATGDLPTRASVLKLPSFAQFDRKYPGERVFAANLGNVRQARPQIVVYPRVSAALGQAIVAALLGQATPRAALNAAARQADTFLSPGG